MYSHMIYKVVGMTASLSGQDIDDDRTTAFIYIYIRLKIKPNSVRIRF